jgi:hypothetical protein
MKTTKKLNEGFLADTANRVPAVTAPAAASAVAYQTPDGSWTSEIQTRTTRSTQPGFSTEAEALADAAKRAAKIARDNRLPIDAEARKKNRTLPTPKVLELLKNANPGLFNLAEVVGKWVWVTFRETPAPELRQVLAQLGFHWNRERQAWQHPCGAYRLRGVQDPHEKYSSYYPADSRAA